MSSKDTYNRIDAANSENPCNNCQRADAHTERCHAECMDYFMWDILQKSKREKKRRENDREMDYRSYKRDILPVLRRKSRRK